MVLTCSTCCSRLGGSSVRYASCSALVLFTSCSMVSPVLYFCIASCEDQTIGGVTLPPSLNIWKMAGCTYLSQSLHFLDLGAQSGLHAADLLLAALQFFFQSLQTLSLLRQSVLFLLQLCCPKLQVSLFLHHNTYVHIGSPTGLNKSVQTAVK